MWVQYLQDAVGKSPQEEQGGDEHERHHIIGAVYFE